MKKISRYLWVVAGIGMFVVCMLLFVGGIEDQINNVNKVLMDNKDISSGNKFSEPTLNNLNNNNESADNVHENTKPEGGEIEIECGAKIDVNKVHVPKEKIIEAIAKGDKKVSEEDIIAIAKELNMSAIELKKEIENVEEVY